MNKATEKRLALKDITHQQNIIQQNQPMGSAPKRKAKLDSTTLQGNNTSKKRKIENKLDGVDKRTNTFKKEVKQTPLHLRKVIQEHYDQDVDLPKEYRRLDSLARLIEGSGICAAAYFDGKKILIASNALKSTSQEKNKTKKLINKVLDYYSQLMIEEKTLGIAAARTRSHAKRIDLFKDICVQNIHGQMAQAAITNCDEYINKFAMHVLNLKGDPMAAENISFVEFLKIIGQEVRDVKVGMLFGAAIIVIPRLASDFRKLEHHFTKYGELWLNKDPVIVQHGDGDNNLHAEMQIIQDIMDNKKSENGYIGISKLCCLDCISVILAINIKNIENIENIENDQSQLDKAYKILVRGQHNICFNDKWEMPEFLKKDASLNKLYYDIKKHIQENHIGKKHLSMMAKKSSTPPLSP